MGRQWRGSCGKILKESMPLLPGLLEAGRELDDELRYSPAVRSELEAMGATGHRSLTCLGASHRPVAGQVDDRGRSVGFRSSIKIRKAGGRGSWPSPGSSRPVTVARCGLTLKGEESPRP